MWLRGQVEVFAGVEHRLAYPIEEDQGADHAPRRLGKRAAHLEAIAQITAGRQNDKIASIEIREKNGHDGGPLQEDRQTPSSASASIWARE